MEPNQNAAGPAGSGERTGPFAFQRGAVQITANKTPTGTQRPNGASINNRVSLVAALLHLSVASVSGREITPNTCLNRDAAHSHSIDVFAQNKSERCFDGSGRGDQRHSELLPAVTGGTVPRSRETRTREHKTAQFKESPASQTAERTSPPGDHTKRYEVFAGVPDLDS